MIGLMIARRIIVLFTAVLSLTSVFCFSQSSTGAVDIATAPVEDDQWDARITEVRGKVFVLPSGKENTYLPARENTPLERGDTVQTGTNGECDIALDGDSLIHVEKGTTFNLASLDRQDSSFDISFGGVLGKIAGLKERNARMEFRTPSGWGSLTGTEFGIETVGNESRMGIFSEGKLAVGLKGAKEEVLLTAGKEISVRAREPLGQVRDLQIFRKRETIMNQIRTKQEILRNSYKAPPAAQRNMARQNLTIQKPAAFQKVEKQILKSRGNLNKEFNRQNPVPGKTGIQMQRQFQEKRIQKLNQIRPKNNLRSSTFSRPAGKRPGALHPRQ